MAIPLYFLEFFSVQKKRKRKQLENESRKVSASQKLLLRRKLEDYSSSSSNGRKERVKKIDAFKTFFSFSSPHYYFSLPFWKSIVAPLKYNHLKKSQFSSRSSSYSSNTILSYFESTQKYCNDTPTSHFCV